MEPLEKKVARFIRENRLVEGTPRVLLAVSGGADSIALLHVMQALVSRSALDVKLICGHINHQLRGSASDGDQAFVVQQARKLKLPVVTKAVDVKGCAETQKLSIETAGRQLRLACLGEVARAHGCTRIATGHQRDDNAETVVQRLRRGTGFRGLAGIWPSRQFNDESQLVRPLLCCTRAEIVAYLQRRDLSWREDHTNVDCRHARNYIRHRLLPILQAASSNSLVDELTELAASAARLHQRVRNQAELAAASHAQSVDEKAVIDAAALASLPQMGAVELVRLQLTELGCGERDLAQHHYKGILELARRGTVQRALTLPGGFLARRECDQVMLQRRAPENLAGIPTASAAIDVPGTSDVADYRIEASILEPTESTRAGIKAW